jgi:transposase
MSLHPQSIDPIPEQTARIARAAFPKGNLYMQMRDTFGTFVTDALLADLFAKRGQPAFSPWRLALVTLFQFVEGLSDRQAADAVRSRIDWKYALSLELEDTGFDSSVLCEFRARLLEKEGAARLFEALLTGFASHGLLKPRSRQRTDSTHILAAIRVLNRLECVGETLRLALEAVARADPDWLAGFLPAGWTQRYGRRFETYRLPAERDKRYALAETIGTDGLVLLQALLAPEAPPTLRALQSIALLRQVWLQQFAVQDGLVRWRTAEELPPAPLLISSPHDAQARYSQKRQTEWSGYKLHLTETCEPDTPNLITDVQTTPATTADAPMTAVIEADLARNRRLPATHIVDTSYMAADQIVASQKTHQVDLLGPVTLDSSWQAKQQQGFDLTGFTLDWAAHTATCPQGAKSVSWTPLQAANGHAVVVITFATTDCRACPMRALCTRSAHGRQLQVRAQSAHEALQQARQRQKSPEFARLYAGRAGIEDTLSQAVSVADVRHGRYIGLSKTHLQHLLTAAALNLLRVGAWLSERPRSQTRRSPLAAYAAG